MARWRVGLAFTIIGVMAIALVVILLDGGAGESGVGQTSTSTTPSTANPTSTTADTTSTTVLDGDARVLEIQAILEGLELARLTAIYEQDEEILTELIASERGIESAIVSMNSLEFVADPRLEGVEVKILDVLLDRDDCLVVYHEFDGTGILGPDAVSTAVRILWPYENEYGYRLVKLWSSPNDLWQDDCDLAITETSE